MLYFAYGSNMDKEDLQKWCRDNNCQVIQFSNVIPAKLKGFELTFNYFSRGRNGGAANIMEAKGKCVYGLLFELNENEIKTIRKKEGCPHCYNEIVVNAESLNGELYKDVKTYKVVEDKERNYHVNPTKEYLKLIIQNAKNYAFPQEYIDFLCSSIRNQEIK